MYKSTLNKQTYITRTANHSTKGNRKGFVDVGVIVDESQLIERPAEVRRAIKSMITHYIEERARLFEQLAPLRCNRKTWSKNVTYKYKGKEHLFSSDRKAITNLKRYFELGSLIKNMGEKIPKNTDIYTCIFYGVAKEILSKEEFSRIQEIARAREQDNQCIK